MRRLLDLLGWLLTWPWRAFRRTKSIPYDPARPAISLYAYDDEGRVYGERKINVELLEVNYPEGDRREPLISVEVGGVSFFRHRCYKCSEAYDDKTGLDPCPECGASYQEQAAIANREDEDLLELGDE